MIRSRKPLPPAKPMQGLWLRGGIYWFVGTVPGFGRVRISLKTGDAAEAIKAARLVRVRPEDYVTRAPDDVIGLYIDDQRRRGISAGWQRQTRVLLTAFLTGTGAKSLQTVTASAAKSWLDRPALSRRSSQSYLTALRTFYAWATQQFRWPVNPIAEIKSPELPPARRKAFLTLEQARTLLNGCTNQELKFCLYCALHAGLRKGEIVAARPRWFDLNAGLLHVQNEADWSVKDRDNRTIPLTDEFLSFLKDYGLRSPYMLAPDVAPGKAVYRYDFRKAYEKLLVDCGLGEFTFHDLRRTFASLLVSRGVSIYKVAKWLGDGVAVVERHYGHLLPNDDQINDAWSEPVKKSKQ